MNYLTLKRTILIGFLLCSFLSLLGCGAYFNTFYNTKKIFNEAEKKRIEQEQQRKKTGNVQNNRTPTRIGEYTKAIEKGSKILELHPKSKYVDDALMIIGQSFYHTGDYIKAQRKYEELITLLPNSEHVPEARLWLGKTFIAQNDFSQGRAVLNELVTQDVDKRLSGDAQMFLGELYFTQEDFLAAIEEFENTVNIVKKKEDKIQAQLRIGQCYIELNDYKKAAESFQKSLTFKPELEQRYILELNYGQALRQIKEFNPALNVFDKMTKGALTKDEMASIRLEIAETLVQMREDEKAKIALEDVIKDFPKTDQAAQAYYKLSHFYMIGEGDFKEALNQLNFAQQEFGRSVIKDSIVFWQKNLQNWDKLNFELGVYQKAFENLDTATEDTTGDFIVQESDEDDNSFDFQDIFGDQDSSKVDSLKLVAMKDSVLADSLKRVANNPNANIQNQPNNPNNRGTQGRNLSLNNPSQQGGRSQNTQKPKKVLKKVTVPKSPIKLKSKFIESTNRMAELYMFQFDFPDSAIVNYDLLINSFPEHSSYPHWLYTSSFLLQNLGYEEEADSLKNEIITNFPESEYALQLLDKKAEVSVEEPGEGLFNLAEEYLLEKEMMDSSIYVYQKIVDEYPESEFAPKSLYSIAYIYDWFKNDTSNALDNYRKLVAEYPTSDYAKAGKKKITAVSKYISDAKKAAEKAIQDSLQKIKSDSLQAIAPPDTSKVISQSDTIKINNEKSLPPDLKQNPKTIRKEEDDEIGPLNKKTKTNLGKTKAKPDSVKTKKTIPPKKKRFN